jgi:hypothetical protein
MLVKMLSRERSVALPSTPNTDITDHDQDVRFDFRFNRAARALFLCIFCVHCLLCALYGIADPTKDDDCGHGHAPLLIRCKRLIKRLPCVCEPFKVGRSLSQSIGASIQKLDRISVAHGFEPTVTQHTNPCLSDRPPSLPVLCPGAESIRHGWPIFLLLRCQLQCGFGDADPRIR